jgi:hypothetical protein
VLQHPFPLSPFRAADGVLEPSSGHDVVVCIWQFTKERDMGFGRGILLWLLGVPLPIIILLALFWHH